ncbi:DUF2971 domain-containing protein [Streptococcus sanguinis]|uniref:DUF2971 domain-containing protein n=1 Tax=Streptococcus sanguinis TaxID=1305 RepID=UPI001CBE5F48|nr:DUF2971 domain-containing protein [Streptococcus sanguinis]MBZ2074216.1 DUF2971 domain-containing protein [Streptococcus sanguinis]MBZ2082328.1 DUF2971 domain-containing protein [Streptococcus sanguinis]MCC3165870.1 hypothetical protein [Streptococcus sanguinis]
MFNIAWDNVLYYKNLVKSKKAPNTIVFYPDDWNDYGYYLTFTVCYYDQYLNETLIGNYRIYNPSIEMQIDEFGIKTIFTQIHSDMINNTFYNYDDSHNVEGINCNYYSLAQDISFYQHLYTLGTGYYETFLKVFRDLTVIDLPDDIKENEGVKKALLRNDGITKSAEIIELNQQLKEIDECWNVGNYISNILQKLKDDQLNDEKIEVVSKIIEVYDFDYGLYFDLLSELLKVYLGRYDKSNFDKSYELLKLLLDKTDFEQLKSELETNKNENLGEISTSVKKIKDTLRYSKTTNDDSFIHYTSLNTLKFLLYKTDDKNNYPKLRLSNARQMNDPNEGYILFNLIGIEKEELPETDYDTSPFFFASMTQIEKDQKLDDSLPMWKQYGDDAKGINLTYHSDYIKSLMDDGIEIYKVCYNVEADSLKEEIDAIKSAFDKIKQYDNDDKRTKYFSSALNLIDDIRYLFKETDYSYENEYRIIKSYEGKEKEIITSDSSNSVIPGLYTYIDKELKYSKIKLGPKCDDIDFVAPYIKHIDRKIEVTRSEISYR